METESSAQSPFQKQNLTAVKNCAKAEIKVFCSCSILLDSFILCQIFCRLWFSRSLKEIYHRYRIVKTNVKNTRIIRQENKCKYLRYYDLRSTSKFPRSALLRLSENEQLHVHLHERDNSTQSARAHRTRIATILTFELMRFHWKLKKLSFICWLLNQFKSGQTLSKFSKHWIEYHLRVKQTNFL